MCIRDRVQDSPGTDGFGPRAAIRVLSGNGLSGRRTSRKISVRYGRSGNGHMGIVRIVCLKSDLKSVLPLLSTGKRWSVGTVAFAFGLMGPSSPILE